MPANTQLPLGADPLGRTWALNLRTGHVEPTSDTASLVDASNTQIIPRGEVNSARLARILSEGGWTLRMDPAAPDVITIPTEAGDILVVVESTGYFLRLVRVFEWNYESEHFATPNQRAEALECLNRASVVLRCLAVNDPVPGFAAVFDFPISGGITRAQVLEYVRRFVSELGRAIAATGVREGLL
jgi:hypothetical protein